MKLVFLNGAPATGKWTVAQELAKLTGFKIMHNHLTGDVVREFFDWGDKEGHDLHKVLKFEILSYLSKSSIKGIIMTYCFATNSDESEVKRLLKLAKKCNFEVCFVRLSCDVKELKRRVRLESRKKHRKLTTCKDLDETLNHWEFSAVPGVENLEIENTTLSAKKVAKMIKEHFKL